MKPETLICPRRKMGFESGEGLEWCPAAHAERNAIVIAARLGHSTEGCTLYLSCGIPCRECAKEIVNAGIVEVVVTDIGVYDSDGLSGEEILYQCGVEVRPYGDLLAKWDRYFYEMAHVVAGRSVCLSRQIGAVLVRDGKFVVSTGYNGPPVGYPHCGVPE